MLKDTFRYSSPAPDAPTIERKNGVFAYHGNVDPQSVRIINPNTGQPIRKAFVEAEPSLLGTYCASTKRWTLHRNAVLLWDHPDAHDPDFAGLYTRLNASSSFHYAAEGNLLRLSPAIRTAPSNSQRTHGQAAIISLMDRRHS